MRIIHVMRSSEKIYGAERVLVSELAALKAEGIDTRFVLLQETRQGAENHVLAKAVADLGVPCTCIPVTKQFSPATINQLRQTLLQEQPQLIHTHGYKADVFGLAAARLAHIPIIGEISGWLFPKNRPLIRFYEWLDAQSLKHMDRTVVLANYYRRLILQMGFAKERIRIIPSGVDIAAIRARIGQVDVRAKFGVDSQTSTVGMLTRLSEEKGVDIFLQAMALVIRLFPSVKCLIFGAGPEEDNLKGLAHRLGIGSHIIWAGYINEAVDALLALDIVVQSSRTEALPQTLMEAMTLSRPVVVTPVGGCPELVVDGTTGFIAPSVDPETLASRILSLLRNPHLAKQMGEAGALRIEERFTMKQWAQRTIHLYEETVAAH